MSQKEDLIRQEAKRLHLSNLKNNLGSLLQVAETQQYSYEGFLEYILSEELKCRNNTARQKRMREASFPFLRRLDDLDMSFMRSLSKRDLNQLAELKWVEEFYHLILFGPPGTGKTHLAIALGIEAIDRGLPVSFINMNDLLGILRTQEINQRSRARLDKIRKSKLLILDEVGYLPIDQREAGLFFHLLSEILDKCSLIITSNKSFDKWPEFLGDADLTLAALDRIIAKCEVIKLEGESYRFENRKTIFDHQN